MTIRLPQKRFFVILFVGGEIMLQLPIILKFLIILLTILAPKLNLIGIPVSSFEANYVHLGIPLEDDYPEGIRARTAWDVECYNGKLFIAGGDYNLNAGPVAVYEYDLYTEIWLKTDILPEEQIEQFSIVNDRLIIPGCDPREDWTYGNLYQYEDGSWKQYRTIPGGIHQFDVIGYNGKLFVGLGVAPGHYPIAVSEDGGNNFQQVPMFRDGILLDTSVPDDGIQHSAQVRVYDFFTLNGKLYAFYFYHLDGNYTREIYQYQDGAFHYHSNLPSRLTYRRISYEMFMSKAEYNGTVYATTGKLYATTDMQNAAEISFGKNAIVSDLRIIHNKLYACVVTPMEDGQYRTSIWVKTQTSNQFRELFYFSFPCSAQSFTYQNESFYFGMGDGRLSESNPANGSVLKVTYLVS